MVRLRGYPIWAIPTDAELGYRDVVEGGAEMGGISEYEGFSGAIALYEGDRELETSCTGYADIPNARPNGEGTVFGMASGCKIFTAIGALQLAERGFFGLDEPVNSLAGGYHVHPAITVRHLLGHTSGIPDYFDEETMDDFEALWKDKPNYRFRKPEDFFPLFIERPNKFEPGERFSYSNSGFVLLAHVIEKASGRSFPEYIRERVFEPAGMQRTGYYRLDMPPPDAAIGYIAENGGFRSNIYSIPILGGGDGGSFTNGRDMNRFWRALASGVLLGRETTELMLAVHAEDTGEGDRYGLGVWIDEHDDRIPFVQGFDPGVRFLSYFNRQSGKTLTICANTECRLGPIVREWTPRLT